MRNSIVFAVLVFGFYLGLLPDSVTLEDSGEMLIVASRFGVAHQPGYPLLGLIGGLLAQVPWGSVAFNVTLMVAAFGAATIFLVQRVLFHITGDTAISYFGGVLAATASVVVHFFSVAEVYSQFTFVFLVCMLLSLDRPGSPWLFFWWGLGLTAHPALFVFSIPTLILLQPTVMMQIRPKSIGVFALGLCPFLFIFLRSQGGDYLAMGKFNSMADAWNVVSMNYVGIETRFTCWGQIMYAVHSLWILARDFMGGGLLLAAVGGFVLFKTARARLALALLWLALGGNVAISLAQRLKYDVMAEQIEQWHVLPDIAVAMLAAAGAQFLLRHRTARLKIAALTAAAALSIVLNCRHYETRSQSRFASEIGRVYLRSLPNNSILLLHGDSDIGPIGYLNRVEGVRPDVSVTSQNGFLLRPPGVESRVAFESSLRSYLIAEYEKGRPIFAIRILQSTRGMLEGAGFELRDHGLLIEVARSGRFLGLAAEGRGAAIGFSDQYARGELTPKHWVYYQEALVGPLCRYLLGQKISHPILESTVYCRYYSLRDSPPQDIAVASKKAIELWRDARLFPEDERDLIFGVVSRHAPISGSN